MKIVELAGWLWYVHYSIAHLYILILHMWFWFIFSWYFNVSQIVFIHLFTVQMCEWRGNLAAKWQILHSLNIISVLGIWTSFTCGEIPLASGGFTDRFSIDWSRHLMKIVELAGWFWYVHNSIAHLGISILHLQYWFIFSGYFNILHTILIYLFTMQMCKWRGN